MSLARRTHLEGCEGSFLAIKRKSFGSEAYRVFPLRCHSWDCPVCAKVKAKIYRARMAPLFDGRPLWMYTFTFFHSRPPLEVWAEFSKAWNRMRTAAAKKYGRFAYARILEHHHNSPYPHLHVIADVNLSDVWLAKILVAEGFGYQARKAPVTTEGAAHYVTKYLTKPWSDDACRRIRKNLHLRIVSFGGDACRRRPTGQRWSFITRDIDPDQIDIKCAVERDWIYGRRIKILSERVFDAFLEQIYEIPDEFTTVEVLNGS